MMLVRSVVPQTLSFGKAFPAGGIIDAKAVPAPIPVPLWTADLVLLRARKSIGGIASELISHDKIVSDPSS
jgi:hypothetical protein